MILEYEQYIKTLVHPIYHFTTIVNMYKILEIYKKHNILILVTPSNSISFTRNFNMQSKELRIDKRCSRISIDYDKLNKNYKIKPYLDFNYYDSEEREERVFKPNKIENEINILSSLIRIDILNEPVFDFSLVGALPEYFFGDNLYLKKESDVRKKYFEYIEKIKYLRIDDLPLYFVDKYQPATKIYY